MSLHSLDDPAYQDNLEEDMKLRSKSMPSEMYRAKSLSTNLNENDTENGEDLTDIRESSVSFTLDPQNSENSQETDMSVDSEPQGQSQNENAPKFTLNSVEYEDKVNGHCLPTRNGLTNSSDSLQDVFRLVKEPGQAAPAHLLPPLDKPVPKDWVTIDEDFVTVCAAYQTHLGSDIIMAPDAHFNDGLIQLVIIRSGITKQQLFSLMASLGKGNLVDNPSPEIEFVKVLAFRLEPELDKDGVIMIDGEKVDYAPVQGQVLPGIANLMAIQ